MCHQDPGQVSNPPPRELVYRLGRGSGSLCTLGYSIMGGYSWRRSGRGSTVAFLLFTPEPWIKAIK